MPLTRTSNLRLIRIISAALIGILIISYAIWRSLNYARGPSIDIFEPSNGSSIATASIAVKGRVERINKLSLNGNAISIDEQGNFSETVIIFPGFNALTLIGSDQFGRSIKTEIDLVGTAELPKSKTVPVNTGSSSASTTEN